MVGDPGATVKGDDGGQFAAAAADAVGVDVDLDVRDVHLAAAVAVLDHHGADGAKRGRNADIEYEGTGAVRARVAALAGACTHLLALCTHAERPERELTIYY